MKIVPALIKIGEKLPDYSFQNTDGDFVNLDSTISDTTLLLLVNESCDFCIQELHLLSRSRIVRENRLPVVVVFVGNPLTMVSLKRELGLQVQMLYDVKREYCQHLEVHTFPCNVVVDGDLRVLALVEGEISENRLLETFGFRIN